ncbi:MAG: glucose-6-phosphate dehydrogenase (NADP(+)), partial [Candidatus Marinimicrobia bacterium]|nr:glucose-6-phosphate dehydrogenase (NADP(+)) [Candidatus Neomarinimicrobiota bacterium]
LQLLAIVAMEPPKAFLADDIRDMKEKVFNALRPIQGESVSDNVIRGQYIDSTIRGISGPGYRQETGVAKNSTTETFVAMRAYIDHPRWQGVPFYIRTGKRLPTRVTEVVIHYKAPVHNFFPDKLTADTGENQLVIRIQPDEGILLKLGMKVPGAGFKLKTIGMDFHYSDVESTSLPDAYERLILDALLGDSTLYARTDGVEAAWAFIDPILKAWQSNKRIKLYGYPAGSWGPNESIDLFEDEDEDWRYPCKNLTGEDTFCEL